MANRQQRRKIKQKKDEYVSENTKNIIITLVTVLIVFLLFYLITVIINNKNRKLNTTEPEETETTIQYEKIIGDKTFTMKDSDYYVIFYDIEGANSAYLNYLASNFDGKIYTVDLNDGFNTKFIGEEVNYNANNASSLKVVDATLIHIVNNENAFIVSGVSEIEKVLKAN